MADFMQVICTSLPLLLVLFMGYWSLKQSARVKASQAWPSTTGRVLFSSVEQRRRRKKRDFYCPKVRYEYTVSGKQYQGGALSFGQMVLSDYDAAAQKAAQYPVGSMVQVYYNPENPADAVLERIAPANWELGCSIMAGALISSYFIYSFFK